MKRLACGDLVPGCSQTFQAATEDEIVAQAAKHAVDAHGMEVTPELADAVRGKIRDDDEVNGG